MNKRRSLESDLILKVLVIGDSGVGKTNLITRYCQNGYKDTYVATIGIDFKIKKFTLENFTLRLQIWDTAGQQRFKNITNTFYKGAAGILIVFSINDEISFQNVTTWIKQINNSASEHVSKVLIGMKSDLEANRKVGREEAQNFARRHNMKYMEASAKLGTNVEQSFRLLVSQIKEKYDEIDEPLLNSQVIQLRNMLGGEHKKCSC